MKSEQLAKKQYALTFLDSLIACQQFLPFNDFDQASFGFYDFQFTTKCSNLSLKKFKQEVKSRKRFSNQWFIAEAKKIFIQISDYLLLNDELQMTCRLGLDKIQNYQKSWPAYASKFKQTDQSSSKQLRKRNVDFRRQLQMAFYLQNYQNNQDLLRNIGEVCKIMSETQNQYIFDLSCSDLWLPLIQKNCSQ